MRLAEGDEQGPSALITPEVRRALVSGATALESQSAVSFEPPLSVAQSTAQGLKTLAQTNDLAAPGIRNELLASLVESAARMEQFDRAMAMARLRAARTNKPDEKSSIEKRLAEILAAQQARQQRLGLAMRIDRSNASPSIYAARILGR
jgi:hypothetical protein